MLACKIFQVLLLNVAFCLSAVSSQADASVTFPTTSTKLEQKTSESSMEFKSSQNAGHLTTELSYKLTTILSFDQDTDPSQPTDFSTENIDILDFNENSNDTDSSGYEIVHVEDDNTETVPDILATYCPSLENLTVLQEIRSNGSSTLILAWQFPTNISYVASKICIKAVSFSDSDEQCSKEKICLSHTVRQFKMRGLCLYHGYNISLSLQCGEEESDVLTVVHRTEPGAPGVPEYVSLIMEGPWSLLLIWAEPQLKNGPIDGYEIVYGVSNATSPLWKSKTFERNIRNFTFTGLKPWTEYTARISAFNLNEDGEHMNSAYVERSIYTAEYFPTAPLNLKAERKQETEIYISWSEPKEPNGPIEGYVVSWSEVYENKSHELVWNTEITINMNFHLKDLQVCADYAITVCAFNMYEAKEPVLVGPEVRVNVTTTLKAPEEPVIVMTGVWNSTTVSIAWKHHSDCPDETNYTVEVWEKAPLCYNKLSNNIRNVSEGLSSWSKNSTHINFLKPYTTYIFRVEVKTKTGSAISKFFHPVRTHPDVPSSPKNFRVDCSYDSTSVQLFWSSPENPNGIVTGYLISYASSYVFKPKLVTVTSSLCHTMNYTTVITDLNPEGRYTFAIQAKTDMVDQYGSEARYERICVLPAGVPPFPDNRNQPVIEGATEKEATMMWSRRTFSSQMGQIVFYSVIVASSDLIGDPENGSITDVKDMPVWTEFWNNDADLYQATPENWNPWLGNGYDPLNCKVTALDGNVLRCIIGWEKNCTDKKERYCNGPLKPGKQYGIKLRGFTRGGFSETYPVFVMTESDDDGDFVLGLSIALVIIILIIISLLAMYIVLKKKYRQKPFQQVMVRFRKSSVQKQDPKVSLQCINLSDPLEFSQPRPLNLSTFLEHVKVMMSDSALKFSIEYEELKKNSPRHECAAAEMEENRQKNRWMDIFPFDHSRVKLLPTDDEPGSDYINASYIPGFSSHREYIATQGPLSQTVDEFWRMIWEQKVTMIVMLAQCVERGKTKCEQYWPSKCDDSFKNYGDLKIQMKSESALTTYTIRIFDALLGSRERTVKQMHFTKWPDRGCPESVEELINFIRGVRENLPYTNAGPILVHCSAGVGRTGTFIAVDRLLQHIQCHNTIDIYNTVMEMREHRINMVQTEDQYIYIHQCMRYLIEEKLNISDVCNRKDSGVYANGQDDAIV